MLHAVRHAIRTTEVQSCVQVKLVKDIQAGTRQFATRQMTWFRDDPMYTWLGASQPASEIVASIVASLKHPMAPGELDHEAAAACR